MATEEQRTNRGGVANLIPYKPGQSGNPGGRPKGRSLTAIVREVLESSTLGGKPIPQGKTVAEVLGDVIVKEALKGKFTFAKEVWDRHDGKVPDKHEIGGFGGGAIEVNAGHRDMAKEELEAWRKEMAESLAIERPSS